MSNLSYFLKENKAKRPNVKYVATQDLKDENGNPVEWEIRPLKSKEVEELRDECLTLLKKGRYKFDTPTFNRKLAVLATVYPDLNDATIQNSYGVMSAEELITELLDVSGDYDAYIKKVNEVSGINKEDEEEEINEIKNLSKKTKI